MLNLKTYLNYINGQWVASRTGKTIKNINPATQEEIALVQESGESDMQDAIEAANRAFSTSNWRSNSALRSRALMQFAARLAEQKEFLAQLYTLNNGKTINEARGELSGSIDMIQYLAGQARMIFGRSIDPDENIMSVIIREPIGVVGIISPWNWPVQLMLRDMIPALAAGNAVVIKPASITAAISMAVIKVLSEVAEIPAGIVNVVTGPGALIGEYMAQSPAIDMIGFTGDNRTGRRITEYSAPTIKKLTLELGGKSPNILFADADLAKAIPAAIRGAFTTSGQMCMAGTRLVVQDTIFAEVIERLKQETEKLKVGNGLDESNFMGPLISRKQLESVLKYIELGKAEGRLVCGGYRLTGECYDQGFFVAPTIFTELPAQSELVQEEIFGPILVVQKFHAEAEAVQIANDTKYGLVAAVWTQDVNRAMRVARAIKAGTVWVNTYFKLFNQTEGGGYKASGIGRARGADGILEFTEIKHLCLNIESN
jgi:betaine-aldehyde dehydrogenase